MSARKRQNLSPHDEHRRAILYARVSTDEQTKGYSLPTQLEACQKYAESIGYDVVASFADDYSGTTPIEQRPKGKAAYASLSSGEADALIVYRMDRLVRPPEEGDEWDIPILIRSLAKLGREIHTVDRGMLETSFAGLLIAVLDGRSAGDERRKILERSMRGRRAKAKHRWVGTSQPPYGYRKVGKGREAILQIDDREAQIVLRIFSLYLGLNGEQCLGTDSIAVLFNDEGISTRTGTRSKHGWRASTIIFILKNPVYIGELKWAGETAILPELAIISRGIFERAQEQRIINRIKAKRNVKHEYLLRGRLQCTCDRKMSAIYTRTNSNSHKDYIYYQCNRKVFEPDPTCDRLKIRAELADAVTWAWLAELLQNPSKMQKGLRKHAQQQRKQLGPKRRRLETLPRLIAESENEAEQLAESLGRVKSKLAIKSLEAQLEQISDAHRRYIAEQERLTAELQGEELGKEEQQKIMQWVREIADGIDNDDVGFATKCQLVERLKVNAKIEYQEGVRGLRLTCVLSYANTWRALSFADSRYQASDLSSPTSHAPHHCAHWLPVDHPPPPPTGWAVLHP